MTKHFLAINNKKKTPSSAAINNCNKFRINNLKKNNKKNIANIEKKI